MSAEFALFCFYCCFLFSGFKETFHEHLPSLKNLASSLLAGMLWPTNRAHMLTWLYTGLKILYFGAGNSLKI